MSISAYAFGLVATAALAAAAPCDIYASGNTPCVAAHSTTRALFSGFNGRLYQVTRASDGTTTDINVQSAGGIADSASQDSFCSGTSCTISIIYDQTTNGNDLSAAPPGGAASGPGPNGYDALADATAAPITLGGQTVYGVYVSPGIGYRRDDTTGIATGNDPEGLYAVVDGTRYNTGCCFDYGNAETDNTDDGASTMEAIYFGQGTGYGTGTGSGPWVLVDMENGLYAQGDAGVNENEPSSTSRFVTAVVKGGDNIFAVKGGDSTTGGLTQYYSGARPSGYTTMNKQGAIILGIGGDNSNGAEGTFYEGAMTSGYPSDDTESSVQSDIVSAGYAA